MQQQNNTAVTQIPIYTNDESDEGYCQTVKDQWEIIEMQGSLSARPDRTKPLDSIPFGRITTKQSIAPQTSQTSSSQLTRCELIIGRQKCEGKKVTTKKPLVIMQKVKHDDNTVHYRIVGVVRDKVHFTSRPVPLSPTQSPKQQQQQKVETLEPSEKSEKIKKATKSLSVHPMFLSKEKKPKLQDKN